MMQMVPRVADFDWLGDRFTSEKPFVFYHAALALQNAANDYESARDKKHLHKVAQEALQTVRNFPGVPDRNTIKVLETLMASLAKQ
jgi:hypothetical protein